MTVYNVKMPINRQDEIQKLDWEIPMNADFLDIANIKSRSSYSGITAYGIKYLRSIYNRIATSPDAGTGESHYENRV